MFQSSVSKVTVGFRWLVGSLVFCLIFSVFQFNFLRTADPGFFRNHQLDSEQLVVLSMLNSTPSARSRMLGLIEPASGQTIEFTSELLANGKGLDLTANRIYDSQLGLQGRVFSSIHKIVRGHLQGYQKINSALVSAIFTVLTVWIAIEFGFLSGVAFCFTVVASPWLTAFARNLYWVIWTWYLPAMVIIYYGRMSFVTDGKVPLKLKVVFAYFIAVLLKCMCGYEYLSTILLASCVPLIYFDVKQGLRLNLIFQKMFVLGGAGVGAFLTVVMVHARVRADSFTMGLHMIASDVVRRTYPLGQGESLSLQGVPNQVSFADVIKPYFFQWNQASPFLARVPLSFSAVMFVFIVSAILLIGKGQPKSKGLGYSFLFSLFAPLSWFILAKGHSYHHTHMNFVLWHLPTALVGGVCLSYLVFPGKSLELK